MGENDQPILKHLTSIRQIKETNSKNYSLVFDFSENEFFTNTELRKRFVFGDDKYNAEYSEGT